MRLGADLRAAMNPGCGLHAAGWAFNRFPIDPTVDERDFVDYVHDIVTHGGSLRRLFEQIGEMERPAPANCEVYRLAAHLLD